jgi:hypothetical protein
MMPVFEIHGVRLCHHETSLHLQDQDQDLRIIKTNTENQV